MMGLSGVRRARSLHLGVNVLDGGHYLGFRGNLIGCDHDADAMGDIAKKSGFSEPVVWKGPDAKADVVLKYISEVAAELQSGDTFFLSFAGHGGLVPSMERAQGGESDDSVAAMYDRMLLDDELGAKWREFQPGVRIIFLSDSCHSGTLAEVAEVAEITEMRQSFGAFRRSKTIPPRAIRLLPGDLGRAVFDAHADLYKDKQRSALAVRERIPNINPCVLLMSACQDRETADDGDHGLFTEKVIEVWNSGEFTNGYYSFWREVWRAVVIKNEMQHASYVVSGKIDREFLDSPVFSI